MIVMTSSEARAYCLGIAQVIPVFLIALFVLERPPYLKISKRVDKRWSKEQQASARTMTKIRKESKKSIRQLVRIDSMLIGLDLGEAPSDAGKHTTRAELIAVRREVENKYRELARSAANLSALLDQAPPLQRDLEMSARKATAGFTRNVIFNITLGVAAELIALWTAVGLISFRIGIPWATTLVTLILGFLSVAAIDRLTPRPDSKRYYLIEGASLAAFIVIAFVVFLMLRYSVTIKS